MVRNMRTDLSKNSGGRDEVERTRSPVVKAPPNMAGIRHPDIAPDNHGMSWHATRRLAFHPCKTKGFLLPMCRPHGPTCTATSGYRDGSLRQRHQGHRLVVQVGPRCGHDTWGTSFHDGFLPRAGPRVLTTGCPPHDLPRTPIGSGGESAAPAGPPPLAPHPNRCACPPSNRTRLPQTRCGSSRAKPVPCLRRVHPHSGWTFHNGFNWPQRRVDDGTTTGLRQLNEGATTVVTG